MGILKLSMFDPNTHAFLRSSDFITMEKLYGDWYRIQERVLPGMAFPMFAPDNDKFNPNNYYSGQDYIRQWFNTTDINAELSLNLMIITESEPFIRGTRVSINRSNTTTPKGDRAIELMIVRESVYEPGVNKFQIDQLIWRYWDPQIMLYINRTADRNNDVPLARHYIKLCNDVLRAIRSNLVEE